MKKNYLFLITTILMIFAIIMNACTNDADIEEAKEFNQDTFKMYFDEMMEIPGISIFATNTTDSYTRGDSNGFPCVTSEDLNYLSSLNQTEFENLHNSLIQKAGGVDIIDSLQVANYMSLYLKVTDNGTKIEKMHRLKDFCINYLLDSEEYPHLTRSEENELSPSELEIYAQQAAFIERVSRPIYEHIAEESRQIASDKVRPDDHVICMEQLGFKLALAGLDIGVGAFLDAMTGGIGTEGLILECLKVGVDATAMWTEYEICNGRWH